MQAISLYLQGKGYKAIGSELKLPRDTVRSWIRAYRQKEGDEIERQEPQDTTQLAEREAMYAAAREEYESSPASLTIVAKKHGVNYANFRNFLQQHHPETALKHTYAKHAARLQNTFAQQLSQLQAVACETLRQMNEELMLQIKRLGEEG